MSVALVVVIIVVGAGVFRVVAAVVAAVVLLVSCACVPVAAARSCRGASHHPGIPIAIMECVFILAEISADWSLGWCVTQQVAVALGRYVATLLH